MKFKEITLILAGSVLMAGATPASAQSLGFSFTPGDLVVSLYGSTTSTTTVVDGVTPITLQEYSFSTPIALTLAAQAALPTTNATGDNVGIVGEDGSSSEGTIQLTGNGQSLTIGGYDAFAAANGIQAASNTANSTSFAAGTAWGSSTIALAQSSDTDVPRVAAVIGANGSVNTSTAYGDNTYNTNNARGVYSPDGTTLYLSGQGSGTKAGSVYTDEGGLYLTTLGNNTTTTGSAPTGIFNAVSTRDVLEYGGNLYYSADQNSKKGDQTGIFEYSGAPTTSQGSSTGTRITPANIGSINLSPEGFVFASSTVLYVADTGDPKAGGTGDGGVQKWVYSGGSWNLAYTITSPNFLAPSLATGADASGETGMEGLAISVVAGNVDIYAVSDTVGSDALANGLYGVVDSLGASSLGSGESFTQLEASPGAYTSGSAGDYTFKGVSFAPVPEPSTLTCAAGGLCVLLGYRRARRRLR